MTSEVWTTLWRPLQPSGCTPVFENRCAIPQLSQGWVWPTKITEKSDNLRKVDIFSIFQVLLWLLCFYQESVRTVLRGPEGFYTVTFNHRTIDYRNSRFNLRFALRVNFGTLRNSLHQFLLFDSLMFIPTFSLFWNFWRFPLLARFDLWDVAYMTSWGLVLEPFGCFHP